MGVRAASLLNAAKAIYTLSLTEKPDAAWHQETLRELALLIEELAEQQAAALTSKLPSPVRGRGVGGEGGRKQQRVLSREQIRAALEAARSEALPHWVKLIAQFPKNPHRPEALYHAGVLFSEGAKPNPEKSVVAFERLTKEFPKSPWTGDAHVRLIDVKLEQQFDLPGAEKHAQAAVKWLETVDKAALEKASRPLGDSSSLSTDHRPLTTAYAIYLRAGLIEYLSERCPKAVEWFEKAKPFAPKRDYVVVHGHIPTGMEKLIELAKSGKFLTPEEARKGDEKAKLVLMLTDVFLEGEEWEKSLDLCNKVVTGSDRKVTRDQRSWARRQRAIAFSRLKLRTDAKREYVAAQRMSPSAPWAPQCLLMAGTIAHNYEKQLQDAIAVFEKVVQQYPKSESAAKAAYFVGVIYEWNSQWSLAKTAYERVIRDYPKSRWASAAMDYHLKKVDAALAASKLDTNKGR